MGHFTFGWKRFSYRNASTFSTPDSTSSDENRRLSRAAPAALAAVLTLAGFLLPASGFAATRTWDGSVSNDWTVAGNWDTGVPGAGDTAVIPNATTDPLITTTVTVNTVTISSGGVLTVNGTLNTTNLNMTNGTVSGTGPVNISGTYNHSSGTMDGTGTTTIGASGTGNFDSSYLALNRPFVNNGDITMTGGSAYFYMNTGGSFVNGNGALVDIQHNTYAWYGLQNTLTVTNTGTVRRSTSSGAATIYNIVFTNTSPGTVQVQSGKLDFSTAGSSTNTGAFTISAGATLDLGGTATRTISGSITGSGFVIFSSGTTTLTGTYSIANTTISGGTVNFNQASTQTLPTLTMTGSGTLAGTANISITTLFDMNNGTMAGGGTTTLANGATGTFDNSYLTLTRPFVNNGDITLSSNAYFYMNTGASFTNGNSGTVDIQHNTYAWYGQVNTLAVVNTGTIMRSTSSGTATIYNVVLTNTNPGSIQVQSGTLDLSTAGSSTNTGSFTVSGGATLDFGGSATRTISGPITGGGALLFSAGTTTLTGTYSISNTTISGATVNFNQAATQNFANLTMNSGTIAGSANLNITTLFDLNSGTMTGGGTTTLANGATGTFDSSYLTLTRPFVNNGTITLSSNAYFYINTGGTFTNGSSGTVDIQHNTYAFYGQVNTVPVINTGAIMRTTSSGTATIYNVVFTNTNPGTVSVEAGSLVLNTTGTSTNTGDFSAAGGTTLEFSGTASRTISGAGSVTGAGGVEFSGGTTTIISTYSITNTTVSGGTVNFNQASAQALPNLLLSGSGTLSGTAAVNITTLFDGNSGTLAGTGPMTLVNGATATLDLSTVSLTRPFVNHGAITMSSNGYFNLNTGGSFTNSADGTVEIQHNTYAFYGSASGLTLSNAGHITRTTSSGIAYINNLNVTNTGTVECQSGTLDIYTYTQTAGHTILSGGDFNTSSTTWNINGGDLTGTGTITGNLSNAALVSPGQSPGSLTITGNYTQTINGTLDIEIDGTTPGTDFDQLVVQGTVTLAGSINITTGFTPLNYTNFTIISNGLSDAVSGVFTGATEGTVIVTPTGNYRISYIGGDGNDVVLTALAAARFNTVAPCRAVDTRRPAGPSRRSGAHAGSRRSALLRNRGQLRHPRDRTGRGIQLHRRRPDQRRRPPDLPGWRGPADRFDDQLPGGSDARQRRDSSARSRREHHGPRRPGDRLSPSHRRRHGLLRMM